MITSSDYLPALIDWCACAVGGGNERAVQAMRAVGEGPAGRAAVAGAAGHVLDYDDTLSAGVVHVSAATAPAALILAAELDKTQGDALEAFAAGWEALAEVAVASHPVLYDRGWHPTTVCGPVGAVVAAANLLELDERKLERALGLALLRAGGTRGTFGTDGKAIQVGLASAAGVQGAMMAEAGAEVDPRALHGPVGFEAVLGAVWPAPDPRRRWIEENWIKLHPSCLGTHAAIDAAEAAAARGARADSGALRVRVDPVARQAAHLDAVEDGLAAKFSIPYCVAFTLLHGAPGVADFAALDPDAQRLAEVIVVEVDATLPRFGAVVSVGAEELARVDAPRGSPRRPLESAELEAKLTGLAGGRLSGAFDDLGAPAAELVTAIGLRGGALASAGGDGR